MTKLTAVYLTSTQHVLAALTRTDPPQGDEPVSALVGLGLPVRFIGQLPVNITVRPQDLSVVTVDNQPDVVINRQNYQVVTDPMTQARQVKKVGAANQVTLAIDTTFGATVTVTANTSPLAMALVVLQKIAAVSPPPIIQSLSTVPYSMAIVLGPAGFAKNDVWNMYALVQGLPPVSQQITVL